jgi:LacI family transcriptional regulator
MAQATIAALSPGASMPNSFMAPRRPTLTAVAQRAEVSLTTASYVVNGRDREMRIAQETRDRVLRAASELDYRPHLMLRRLNSTSVPTLVMLTDTAATDPYAGQLIEGALAEAARHGHLLVIAQSSDDEVLEEQLIRGILDRGLDRVLYATRSTREIHLPTGLRNAQVVLLNCFDARGEAVAVLPDEEAAGRAVARVLLDAGHVDGVFLLGGDSAQVLAGRQRAGGLRAGLRQAGTALAGIIDCDWWPESAERAVLRYLQRHPRPAEPPRALVCQNDRAAFGAYLALAKADLAVPGDVSVVTFEGSPMATWVHPRLTSVDLPHYDMGVRAVDRLVAEARHPGVELVAMPLRERDSVAPPRVP